MGRARSTVAAHAWWMLVACVACGEPPPDVVPAPPEEVCATPNRLVGERCLEPGVADDGCPAGTLGQADGSCRPAGMLAEDCAEGFVHLPFEDQTEGADGVAGSCEPIIPADVCPTGLMAVPGDAACRPVADCGSGTWGNIPHDQNTVFVDQSFTGVSDGSINAPFTTIGAGVAAAPPGGLIAIAAGSYLEDIVVEGKPVVLWGVCPSLVEVIGLASATTCPPTTICMKPGASGSELHGLAVGGPADGVSLRSGVTDVLLARLWVHDTGFSGVWAEGALGSTSLTIEGSLIERTGDVAVFGRASALRLATSVIRDAGSASSTFPGGVRVVPEAAAQSELEVERSVLERNAGLGLVVQGSSAAVDGTVVRGTTPHANGFAWGEGIVIKDDASLGLSSTAVIDGSFIVGNRSTGIQVEQSSVVVERTTVRDTGPRLDGLGGSGISVWDGAPGAAPSQIHRCVIEANHDVGLFISGSVVAVDGTVVRATQPDGNGGGNGMVAATSQGALEPGALTALTVRGAVAELNHQVAVFISGAQAQLEAVRVRDTLPDTLQDEQGRLGIGISFQEDADAGRAASGSVSWSVVERCHYTGISLFGSEASITGTLVSDTRPDASGIGRSVSVSLDPQSLAPSAATLLNCRFSGSHEAGVVIGYSSLDMVASHIERTQPAAGGGFGDGLGLVGVTLPLRVFVDATRIEDSARAGISNFGSSISLGNTLVRCAALNLNGEEDFDFEDRGGNGCGCPDADQPCRIDSTSLPPLDAPTPVE